MSDQLEHSISAFDYYSHTLAEIIASISEKLDILSGTEDSIQIDLDGFTSETMTQRLYSEILRSNIEATLHMYGVVLEHDTPFPVVDKVLDTLITLRENPDMVNLEMEISEDEEHNADIFTHMMVDEHDDLELMDVMYKVEEVDPSLFNWALERQTPDAGEQMTSVVPDVLQAWAAEDSNVTNSKTYKAFLKRPVMIHLDAKDYYVDSDVSDTVYDVVIAAFISKGNILQLPTVAANLFKLKATTTDLILGEAKLPIVIKGLEKVYNDYHKEHKLDD